MKSIAKQHTIYLIDREKAIGIYRLPVTCSDDRIIDSVVNRFSDYREEPVKEALRKPDVKLRVFAAIHPFQGNVKRFFSSVLDQKAALFRFELRSASTMMFITTKNNLFVVTTGIAHACVCDIIHSDFGMEYISHFANNMGINEATHRNLAGSVYQNKRYFAKEETLVAIDNLNAINKDVGVRVRDVTFLLEHLGMSEKSKKKSVKISAGPGLRICKSMTIDGLLKLLQCCDSLTLNESANLFSGISMVSPKRDKLLRSSLLNRLVQKVVTNSEPYDNSLFLVHRNIDSFMQAISYTVFYNGASFYDEEDTNGIISAIRKEYRKKSAHGNKITPYDFFKSITIKSKGVDDVYVTEDSLLNHIVGELYYDGKVYYFERGSIYKVSESYSSRLTSELRRKIEGSVRVSESFGVEWSNKEDDYNNELTRALKGVQLHKITPDNVEFADVLIVNDDELRVVHVKEGFDGSMRVLSHQVALSLRCLTDSRHDTKYMQTLYKQATTARKEMEGHFPTFDSFVEALRTRKITYVIALHVREKVTDLESLLQSKSIIAKHCLLQIINECYENHVKLEVELVS